MQKAQYLKPHCTHLTRWEGTKIGKSSSKQHPATTIRYNIAKLNKFDKNS